MSLTQHLYRPGAVRAWWEQRSGGLTDYAHQLAAYANRSVPLSQAGAEHAAQVGGIVGRRVETLVEPAPPYAAILAGGTPADACQWPTHAHLTGTEDEANAVEWRPTPTGFRCLVPAAHGHGQWSETLRTVATIEAAGGDKRALIEAAAAVTALESAYRSGAPVRTVPPRAVTDAAHVMARMRSCLASAARLCGGTLRGHAAPVLAPHWADGDILLGPGRVGYGLIDVKTVGPATLREPSRVLPWLWQLLSYAAADAEEDLWRIRAVGVLLSRQDALLVWPTAELWAAARVGAREQSQLVTLLNAAYAHDSPRKAGT